MSIPCVDELFPPCACSKARVTSPLPGGLAADLRQSGFGWVRRSLPVGGFPSALWAVYELALSSHIHCLALPESPHPASACDKAPQATSLPLSELPLPPSHALLGRAHEPSPRPSLGTVTLSPVFPLWAELPRELFLPALGPACPHAQAGILPLSLGCSQTQQAHASWLRLPRRGC